MKQNIIIKAGGVFAVVLVVGFFVQTGKSSDPYLAKNKPEAVRLANGLDADTPEDTIRTLAADLNKTKIYMAKQQDTITQLQSEKIALTKENQTTLGMLAGIKQDFKSELSAFRKELELEKGSRPTLTAGQSVPIAKPELYRKPRQYPNATVDADGTVWVPPMDEDKDSTIFSSLTAPLNLNSVRNAQTEPSVRPVYTLSKNSTLVGARAFTGLIGRIPSGDSVIDPYSFKISIGAENLIANGQRLPELAGAIATGKAYGDMTLRCVSGDIFSITFIFKDGREKTIPRAKDITEGGSTTPDLKIGELSDNWGNPCIPGELKTNAGKYLAESTLAAAISAAATAAASSQTTTSITGLGGVSGITGSKNDYILNETISGAAEETAQWLRDRRAQEHDVIYVKPGEIVAVHLTEQLRIDYENDGRLVRYENQRSEYRPLD